MKFQRGDLVAFKGDGRPVIHKTVGVVCNIIRQKDYDPDQPDAPREKVMVYWCWQGGSKMDYYPKYLKLLQRQER